jgi:hypothetical protein
LGVTRGTEAIGFGFEPYDDRPARASHLARAITTTAPRSTTKDNPMATDDIYILGIT